MLVRALVGAQGERTSAGSVSLVHACCIGDAALLVRGSRDGRSTTLTIAVEKELR